MDRAMILAEREIDSKADAAFWVKKLAELEYKAKLVAEFDKLKSTNSLGWIAETFPEMRKLVESTCKYPEKLQQTRVYCKPTSPECARVISNSEGVKVESVSKEGLEQMLKRWSNWSSHCAHQATVYLPEATMHHVVCLSSKLIFRIK